jgi:ubiquinone/menaquinone biosynthesis C-methylase UbiE
LALVTVLEPDEQRAASREGWERVAQGWGSQADRMRDWGMPVSEAMVDSLGLVAGQRVLELAAGPGDTGFMAAARIRPGGVLISSDGAEAMVEVARGRAARDGVDNVEFRQLELEWIDLPTASVDAILCRWGIMLTVDPEAAAREARRVLRTGGRAAFAVWDAPERNPWATIPSQALIALGHAEPPDRDAPGMFSLAADGALRELLESAGFVEVRVQPVALNYRFESAGAFIDQMGELSQSMSNTVQKLSESGRRAIREQITEGVSAFTAADGSVSVPGSSLVGVADA